MSPQTLAWLTYAGRSYYSKHSPLPHEPHSAVTRLIQGIWERDPRMAQKILRGRIFTTAEKLTLMCRGMIDVAAKRVTIGAPLDELPQDALEIIPLDLPLHDEAPFTASLDSLVPRARELALESRAGADDRPRFTLPRGVAAALIDPTRGSVSWAVNRNASNRTLHAEVLLVQSYWARHHRPLPEGARILTTLQPCRMCAGMIAEAATDLRHLDVVYLDPDPGPAARLTALESIARRLYNEGNQQLE